MFPLMLVLMCLLLAGCETPPPATVQLNAVHSFFIRDRVETDKNYKPGYVHTVYVGEPVIKRKSYAIKTKSELFGVLQMDIQLLSKGLVLALNRGKHYPVKYQVNKQGRVYHVVEAYHHIKDHYYGVMVDGRGALHHQVLDGNVELPGIFEISPINAQVELQRVESVISRKNTENFEILFGGITDNQINLTYREYTSGDIAKTAFFQDLTYPVSAEFIGYKSLKIKVHQVTGEHLSFVVVEE